LCTTLSDGKVSISTIEHLMAALSAVGVSNCQIETGGEIPILDGSSLPFAEVLLNMGLSRQSESINYIRVKRAVKVEDGQTMAMLMPASRPSDRHHTAPPVPRLLATVDIDFRPRLPQRQWFSFKLAVGDPTDAFMTQLAPARTFTFKQEVAQLRSMGLIKGGSLDNAVVFDDVKAGGAVKVVNEEGLRFEDEWVRHKALDAFGDLALAGMPLHANYYGLRCGHAINHALVRALFSDKENYAIEAHAHPNPMP
jgi:UDP-3-O-[3-hydroxymyristoyl] N-acetylglucosamine deacetylase